MSGLWWEECGKGVFLSIPVSGRAVQGSIARGKMIKPRLNAAALDRRQAGRLEVLPMLRGTDALPILP
jgi:hypothetical protein